MTKQIEIGKLYNTSTGDIVVVTGFCQFYMEQRILYLLIDAPEGECSADLNAAKEYWSEVE